MQILNSPSRAEVERPPQAQDAGDRRAVCREHTTHLALPRVYLSPSGVLAHTHRRSSTPTFGEFNHSFGSNVNISQYTNSSSSVVGNITHAATSAVKPWVHLGPRTYQQQCMAGEPRRRFGDVVRCRSSRRNVAITKRAQREGGQVFRLPNTPLTSSETRRTSGRISTCSNKLASGYWSSKVLLTVRRGKHGESSNIGVANQKAAAAVKVIGEWVVIRTVSGQAIARDLLEP
jgi:hypothetical protein